MELTYYLKKGEKDGEFDYVPAWILSQYDEYQDYSEKDNPTQMVVIDARDGSVIDLLELSKSLGTYYTYDDTPTEDGEDTDATDTEDTSAEDTSTEDNSAEDTSAEDNSAEDTSEE